MESVNYIKTKGKIKDYWVGDNGEIFSIGGYRTKKITCILLKKTINGAGYESSNCVIDGSLEKMVHRSVYRVHVGNIEKNMHIDHIDRNKRNNSLSNLRCVTIYQNQSNKNDTSGENHPHSKLANKDAVEICKLYKTGMQQEQIGKIFGINRKTVSNIIRGITYVKATEQERLNLVVRRNSKRSHTKIDIEKLKELVDKGVSRSDIAKIFNINVNYIYTVIKIKEARS